METKTVNLRDLPEELVRQGKACAALHGISLKEFVVRAIAAAVDKDFPAMRHNMAAYLGKDPGKRGLGKANKKPR